eukprot:937752-Rhodomonas_salina.1
MARQLAVSETNASPRHFALHSSRSAAKTWSKTPSDAQYIPGCRTHASGVAQPRAHTPGYAKPELRVPERSASVESHRKNLVSNPSAVAPKSVVGVEAARYMMELAAEVSGPFWRMNENAVVSQAMTSLSITTTRMPVAGFQNKSDAPDTLRMSMSSELMPLSPETVTFEPEGSGLFGANETVMLLLTKVCLDVNTTTARVNTPSSTLLVMIDTAPSKTVG